MQNINIPEDVAYILHTLTDHGYEAYIVGGCVRDSILGRIPNDWDVTTSAEPKETKPLFKKTFDTGIQHGTITIVLNKTNYEVTTYRVDGDYADCRHPEQVSFTKNLKEDLLRRDFTMNAIAYHPKEGFRDPFHGREDIEKGIIRGVGVASLRFQEDALRMLRCVRFAAQLGFEAEESTYQALCENKALIEKISKERIREELEKLWTAPHTEKMPMLWESGLLEKIDPVLSQRLMPRADALLAELERIPKNAMLRWCLVLQDYTPNEAKAFLKGMKFDNNTLKRVCLLLEYLHEDVPVEAYPLRKLAGKMGTEALLELLSLQEVLRPASPYRESKALLEEILKNGDCLTLKTLALSGKDLMALGIPHGNILGELLAELLDLVLQDPAHNEKDLLTADVLRLAEEKGVERK